MITLQRLVVAGLTYTPDPSIYLLIVSSARDASETTGKQSHLGSGAADRFARLACVAL